MRVTVRRLAANMGLASGATAAAAMIGLAVVPNAHADAIDELLMQSEGDLNEAATIFSGVDTALLPSQQAGHVAGEVSSLEGLSGLISQIQSQQDALTESLQSSALLVGADNNLASASGDVLSAVNAYVDAADAGDYAAGATLSGEVTGYFDRLDLVYAEVFQFLPAALNDEFTTVLTGFPNVEPVTVPTDIATSAAASPAADGSLATDLGLLGTAQTDITDALTVLAQVPGATIQAPPADLADLISKFDAIQTPLLSSDNGVVSGLGEALFNGPDQQLAQSSDALLSAAQAFAADPTSGSADFGALSATLQWGGSLLFDSLPANVLGTLLDKALDLPVTTADPSMAVDLLTSIGL